MEAWADAAEQQKQWLVVIFHGVDGIGWEPLPIDTITAYLDYLKAKNLGVRTLGAMVKYIKERASATLSVVSSSSDQIVLSLTDTLDDAIYNEPLTIRSEVPSGWALVNVQQGSGITTVTSAVEGTTTVIYYKAIPDGGLITLQDVTTPQLTALNPQSVAPGSGGFMLQATGNHFATGSVVRWNGSDRVTTFVSASQLQASITAADVSTAGTVPVTVFTAGGGLSNAMTFAVQTSQLTVTSLSPSSATAGGPSFTLTVNGTNFASGSTVRWNGSSRGTTFISASQLTAVIAASDISVAGTAMVSVLNPSGALSNSLTLQINNPVPSLTSLNPPSAIAGSVGFTLTVTGSNFINGSVVRWNNSDRVTTFVSGTQLQATITTSDIATAGTASVSVFNSSPGGGVSGALSFTINNPAPSITSLSPSSATAGGVDFTLTVNGKNFVSGAVVQWNGSNRITTYVSATQLTASITASDLATAGTVSVTVNNPAPGGGTSGAQSFTVNNPLPTIASLAPSSGTAGGSAFSLTVTGANFVSGSVVRGRSDRIDDLCECHATDRFDHCF